MENDTDDPNQDTSEVLEKIEELEEVEEVAEVAEEIRSKKRNLAKNSSVGLAYKACSGIKYLIVKYGEIMGNVSKVPRSNMEYLWITFLETHGKGKFDIKRTGTEMSNGNVMNYLMNFEKVTSAMLAAYEEGSKEYD